MKEWWCNEFQKTGDPKETLKILILSTSLLAMRDSNSAALPAEMQDPVQKFSLVLQSQNKIKINIMIDIYYILT